jgi:hypothetical protein
MGSIAIQVVGDVSVGTKVKTWAVADADVNRLVAYTKAAYPNADGTVPTTAQALTSWAQGFMDGTKANVQRFETAAPVVPAPITAT